jgi:hypothetical protein
MALRWKMQDRETGLARVGAAPRGCDLRDDGNEVLHVRPLGGGWRGPVTGWYWYGCGENTAVAPWPTMDAAKAAAMAFFRSRQRTT